MAENKIIQRLSGFVKAVFVGGAFIAGPIGAVAGGATGAATGAALLAPSEEQLR